MGRGWFPSPGSRWEILVENRVVQFSGLFERRHAEFAVKDGDTLPIRLDRSRPVTCPRIQGHDQAMRRLVRGVDPDPSGGRGESGRVVLALRMGDRQAAKDLTRRVAQRFGDRPRPILEVGRVLDREGPEEVASVQVGRP